jgi:TonB family protein
MIEGCQQWEGQHADGKFVLQKYLGGSEHSAVFLTEREAREPQKAAIKLTLAGSTDAEIQLSRWTAVAGWLHPHLIRLYESGRCRLGNTDLLYVVMEYAEENLSQVIPERRLTSNETRDVLLPVLDALGYLHGKGFVHGRLKPSNILAIGDRVKVSSDSLYKTGEAAGKVEKPGSYSAPELKTEPFTAAADVWSLGVVLTEMLTQRLPFAQAANQVEPRVPEILPAPFFEIARHCLRRSSHARWTLAEIAAALRPPEPPVEPRGVRPIRLAAAKTSFNWRYAMAIVLAAGALAGLATVPRLFDRKPEPAQPAVPRPAVSQTKPAPVESKPAKPVAGKPGRVARKEDSVAAVSAPSPSASRPLEAADRTPVTDSDGLDGIVHQVTPSVPESALDTIQGTIKVRVRISVDPSGNVTDASFETQGSSQYFARKAMEAAKGWKFASGSNKPRQGVLRFEFNSDSVRASLESLR